MSVKLNLDINGMLSQVDKMTMGFMQRLCDDLVRQSQDRVPLDHGDLMAAIGFEISETRRNVIKGIVFAKNVVNQDGTSIPLDLYVHEGVRPHMPPLDPIKEWAERVLGSEEYAYPIAVAMANKGVDYEVRGQRGRKFYERAYQENKQRYWNDLIMSFLRMNFS